jgi:formylglycine-generating enzyme required for sulfatase activity
MNRLFLRVAVVTLAVWVAGAGGCDTPGQSGREITGKDGAPMVLVPAGEFLYRDDNQRMSLPAFYMDKYEVTTNRYAKYLQATGRKEPLRWHEVSQGSDGDRPVIGVLWDDADAYCRHYAKRLPTEQEWEKAARGTDGRQYPWGNEEPTSRHAHFNKCCQWNGYGTLATAGSYEVGKSPYGIYDLAGNAWEWTSSEYSRATNYTYRVIRGGSWINEAVYLRSTYRTWGPPRAKLHPYFFGFRCAQDAR